MAESIVKELAPMIFQVIAQIPYGRVASYGQIARLAGIPKHSRLVGYVLKHMDADSSLPWYRVINSQGKISLSKLNELSIFVVYRASTVTYGGRYFSDWGKSKNERVSVEYLK